MPQAPRPARSRRRDFEDSRRRILEAARLILAERGPEALTVSEVAHRAGLNRTTAYQHFRTRDALTAAVTEELAEEITSTLSASRPLWEGMGRRLLSFVEHPEVARLVLFHLLSESPIPERAWSSYLAEIREIAGSPDAQPDIDAEMLGYVLTCVGILWPVLARAQYDDAASARRATERLTRELQRLLRRGALCPEAWPDPGEGSERGGSG